MIALICNVGIVSACADETMYVSNTNNTITKFALNGVGSQFTNSGLHSPGGLAVDGSGNVYSANYANTAIEKYTPAGGAGSVFSAFGATDKGGLAFDTSGNLYAAGYNTNTIEKYTTAGAGSLFASDPGDHSVLFQPVGIAFDSLGNLFVASFTKIEEFSPTGVPSPFANPGHAMAGLAIDSADNVYVSYFNDNRIEKFSPLGIDLGPFATDPGDGSILAQPYGLAFDSAGNLYATNVTSFIEKFSPAGIPSRFATDPGDHSLLQSPQFIAFSAVPEPSSLILLSIGALAAVFSRSRSYRLARNCHASLA